MKQGILTKSDALQLTMATPMTPGQSIIYLIEAANEDIDTGNAVLNYYDAANPSVPYTGPNNSNSSQPTERTDKISIHAKAGVPSASPTSCNRFRVRCTLCCDSRVRGDRDHFWQHRDRDQCAIPCGYARQSCKLRDAGCAAAVIGQFQYTDKTTAGTSTVTAPSWANHAEIQVVGGGGGGGSSGTGYAGGGGGAGGYAFGIVSVTPAPTTPSP
jgi:uncharacterized membrane protein YgcG